jgi:hypothetical protein
MTRRKRSSTEQDTEEIRSGLYKTQQAIGDAQALHRGAGHYVKRVVRRRAVRSIFRLFR